MVQLAYLAAAFAALFLFAAAGAWWRVAHPRSATADVGAPGLRMAASATVIAFGLLAVALLAVVLERVGV